MENIRIETERLILRPWRVEDAEDMYEYAKDPDVGPNAGWKPHESVEESRKLIIGWLEDMEKQDREASFVLELKENGKAVGSLAIVADARRPAPGIRHLGYALGKEYWGRGLMTEAAQAAIAFAFEKLSTELLTVTHYVDNLRSKRVIEKCGFVYEGTLRQGALRFDGVFKDLCFYSMTKEEFEGIK